MAEAVRRTDRGRRHGAALIATLLVALLSLPAPATGLELTSDVTALEAAAKAEADALAVRHEAELDAVELEWVETRAGLAAAWSGLAAELEKAHQQTLDQLEQAAAEDRSATEAARAAAVDDALTAHGTAVAEAVARWGGGTDADVLEGDALHDAIVQIRRERDRQLTDLAQGLRAERDEISTARDAALDALEDERYEIKRDGDLERRALAREADRADQDESARHEQLVAQIDAERDALVDAQAHEESVLRLSHEQAMRRAEGRGASRSERQALRAAQELELDDLELTHDAALDALDIALDAEDDAHRSARSMIEAEEAAAEAASEAAERDALGELEIGRATVVETSDAAERRLVDGHEAARALLEASFDDRERVLELRGMDPAVAVEEAVEDLEKLLQDRLAALDESRDDAIDDLDRQLKRQRDAAERSYERVDDEARDEHVRAIRHAEQEAKREERKLERRHHREERQLRSEYWALRSRALAYSEFGDGLAPIGSFYHAPSDPGSPWNVARRIGLEGKPDEPTGAGVQVAMIDTGVVDVDGLRSSSVVIGPDFSFEGQLTEYRGRDTHGHGTHLAGIINGSDDAWAVGDRDRRPERFLGVAPDAELVSIKAGSGDGSVDVSQVIAAINWVVDNRDADGLDIRVLNLAFSTDSVQDYRIDPLTHAVERAWRAGIVVVVAAGNQGTDTSSLTSPAKDPFVIAVGASQSVDSKEEVVAAYSNRGSDVRGVDLLAPGRSIVGLRNPGSYSDRYNETGRADERFVRGSGTSQAAAVVSGAVALLLEHRPELTPDQVKALLLATAGGDRDQDGALVGAGVLRIDEALDEEAPTLQESAQPWDRADGSGSLDAARGSVRVRTGDGVELAGETDIFGLDHSADGWAADAWSGQRWSGQRWSSSTWSGDVWAGQRWSGDVWSGQRWSSDVWSGQRWSGQRWSGQRWSGQRWSGQRWSASGWSSIEAPDLTEVDIVGQTASAP